MHGDEAHGEERPILLSISGVSCLNENVAGSASLVVKAPCAATSRDTFLESSPDDSDLLMNIDFKSTVRLSSVCVCGGEGGAAPSGPARLRLFVNRPDLDFAEAEGTPLEDFPLGENADASHWLALRVQRFNNVSSLQLLFTGCRGGADGDPSRIYYVGLRGTSTGFKRGVVHATYETRAQVVDSSAENGVKASTIPHR